MRGSIEPVIEASCRKRLGVYASPNDPFCNKIDSAGESALPTGCCSEKRETLELVLKADRRRTESTYRAPMTVIKSDH